MKDVVKHERGFVIIPSDDKGYPGMTKLPIDDKRELVCMGTGPEVEAYLTQRFKERGYG